MTKRLWLTVLVWLVASVALADTQILQFCADWCGPCREMKPAVDALISQGIPIKEIDVDKSPDLVKQYQITNVPTLIVVRDGATVLRKEGKLDTNQLASTLVQYGRSGGSSYRTKNFAVVGQTPEWAKAVAESAEKYRTVIAMNWLGRPIPDWPTPCQMTATAGRLGPGGTTTFVYHDNGGPVTDFVSNIQGPPDRLMDSVLPHEITHMVLAAHFRQPIPRWLDEGAASNVEHISEKTRHRQALLQFLRTGRGIAFNRMFAMTEYPPDMMPLYAQGFSAVDYLIQNGGRQKFIKFAGDGMRTNNWTAALKSYYGIQDLGAFQNQWLAWVKGGSPDLTQAANQTLVASAEPCCPPGETCEVQPAWQPAAIQATAVARGSELDRYLLPFRQEMGQQQAATNRRLEAIQSQLSALGAQLAQQQAQQQPGAVPAPLPDPEPLPVPEPEEAEEEAEGGPKTPIGRWAEKSGDWVEEHGGPISSRLAEAGTERLQSDNPAVRFVGWTQVTVAKFVFGATILLIIFLVVWMLHRLNSRLIPILQAKAALTPNPIDDRLVALLSGIHNRVEGLETRIEKRVPIMGRIDERIDSIGRPAQTTQPSPLPAATPPQ